MVLDTGRMEGLLEKYANSPCNDCEYCIRDFGKWEFFCPFFKNSIIPDDIVDGSNRHTKPHVLQNGSTVYKLSDRFALLYAEDGTL